MRKNPLKKSPNVAGANTTHQNIAHANTSNPNKTRQDITRANTSRPNITYPNISRRKFLKTGARTSALIFGSLASGALASGALSACSNDASLANRKDNKSVIVVMNTDSEPQTGFDPFYSWGCGEHVHEPLIQSTLITTDEDLNFVNDLATNYSCSDNGLLWTFDIRKDVKFSDGHALTAKDVAFTINGIKNFEGSQLDLTYVKKATATSKTRVKIELNKPFNALLYTLAVVGIVPQHAYNSKTYGAAPIGSGRYILEQWDRGQQVILNANPNYYGDAPNIEKLTVVFMEEDAAHAAAQSGEVDVCYTSATLAAKLPQNYSLLSCSTVDCMGISLPCIAAGKTKKDGGKTYSAGNDVTCHEEIRKAINYAIDRQKLVDNVLNGYGAVAYSVCDTLPWSSKDMQVKTDTAKAAKILENAGWKKGNDGIYIKSGLRASFELFYPANDSVRQAIANEFMNQMKNFGIEVNITGSSWSTDADGLYAHQYSDPIVWGWGSNSPTQLYDLSFGSSAGNYSVYENKAVDKHLDSALAKTKVEDSFGEWQKAQWDGKYGIAPLGGASWVWLANVDHLYFVRNGLEIAKQKPHPHGHGWSLVNNVDQWFWK